MKKPHLIGYNGKRAFDAGIIYAPYIPVQIQKTILTIEDKCLRCGGKMIYSDTEFLNAICLSCHTIMMESGQEEYQRLFKLYKQLNKI